jgi:hypothetical protein
MCIVTDYCRGFGTGTKMLIGGLEVKRFGRETRLMELSVVRELG